MLLELDPVEEAYAYAVKDKRTMRPPVKVRPEGMNFFRKIDEWQKFVKIINNHKPAHEVAEHWSDEGYRYIKLTAKL